MTAQPVLGTSAKYLKINSADEVIEGEGVIIATFIDASRQVCATLRLRDATSSTLNCYAALLDASEQKKQDYINAHREIKEIEKQAAQENIELVKKYNALIDAKYDEVLGARIEVPETATVASA